MFVRSAEPSLFNMSVTRQNGPLSRKLMQYLWQSQTAWPIISERNRSLL